MASLRKANAYSKKKVVPYTRVSKKKSKSYVKTVPHQKIAADVTPPSPEHIPFHLKQTFVGEGKLKMKYILWYRDLMFLHKKIAHKKISELKGVEIDQWQERTDEFIKVMTKLVGDIIS